MRGLFRLIRIQVRCRTLHVRLTSVLDDSLSEYVIVLLTNHHAQESVVSALKDFLSPSHVKDFVDWLFYKRSELYASGERTLPPGETALGKKMEGLDFKPTRIFETALKDLKEPPALTSAPPPAPSSFAHTSKDPAEARRLRAERFRLHSPDRQIRTPRDRSPASHRRELSPGKPLFYRSIFSSSGERMEVERPFRRERKDSLQVTDARELISAKKRDYSKAAPRPRRSSIDRGDRMPSEKARADQKMVRCSYWPNCKLAGDCPFVHPSEICKHFPSCTFGDTCIYIHPAIPCKFQDRCQNSNCNYQHTPLLAMAKLSSNSSSFSTSHNPYLPPSAIPCRFFPNCRNAGCPFLHPRYALSLSLIN